LTPINFFVPKKLIEKNRAAWLRTTVGFAQAGQKEVQSTVLHIQALVRAGQSSPNISSYFVSLSKAKQRFRAEGILMPHLLQSPNVACYYI